MSRNEIVELIKSFCLENSFTFIDDILVGNYVLVLINGQNCVTALDAFLIKKGLEHTMPSIIIGSIGSYITIS